MHAEVYILDRNLERLRQVDHHFRGGAGDGGLEHPRHRGGLRRRRHRDRRRPGGGGQGPQADQRRPGRPRCATGSVLVDISVDQGGCFESTRPTTHSDPTFEVNGSLFYCVANMPGAVPHSSTHALVNATLPYVLNIANHGWKDAVSERPRPGRGRERGRRAPSSTSRWPRPTASTTGRCPSSSPDPARAVRPVPPDAAPPVSRASRAGTVPGRQRPRGDVVGQPRCPSAGPDAGTGSRRTVRSGTSPAHTSRSRSSSSSSGGPALTLTEDSARARRSTRRPLQLLDRRVPGVAPLPGHDVLADGFQAGQLLGGVVDERRAGRRPWRSGS